MTPEEVLDRHAACRIGTDFEHCDECGINVPSPCVPAQMAQRVQAAESRVAELEGALHKLSTSGDWEAALVRAALAEPRRNALEADL